MGEKAKMDIGKLFRGTEESKKKAGADQGAKPSKKSVQPSTKAKKAEAAKKTPRKSDEPSAAIAWWQSARQYLREVGYEMRKVVWPSRKETIGSTSVVVVIVLITGVFLGLVDMLLSRIMRLFVG
jgi:preprotein translocase subunit SecE